MRIGVASIMQETNSFSLGRTTLSDFRDQGLYRGQEVLDRLAGTNTEIAGAADALTDLSIEPIGLVRALALAGPELSASALDELAKLLVSTIEAAKPLDGLVLSLHGAMAAEDYDTADSRLAAVAREALGDDVPLGVCLDLHANVTISLLGHADLVIGYRTYPHVDQAETGERAARLVGEMAMGRIKPQMVMAKRPMLVPAETSQTTEGPMSELRHIADRLTDNGLLDISLFTVQPWLDVEDIGFVASACTDGPLDDAEAAVNSVADRAWSLRGSFDADLASPGHAIELARERSERPVLLSESADSPTGGASGDSAAMIRHLLEHGRGMRSYTTIRDAAGAEACMRAGVGATVSLTLGSSLDDRFHDSVSIQGRVASVRDEPVTLTGPVWTGMELSLGKMAAIEVEDLYVLVAEVGPFTFDPAIFEALDLDPRAADIIVVRSATLFRPGFARIVSSQPIFLDLPGATTPRFQRLPYSKATRPLYPLEKELG